MGGRGEMAGLTDMHRRLFLRGVGMLGCSVAANPWLSTVTLAGSDGRAPLGENRLVVVILRGAMDGLDVVQPLGDPLFATLRPRLGTGIGAADLDGRFALHSALGGLMPLWAAGELAFVHAVSTPYRDKRSHFDGQDMLEAGTGMDVPPQAIRDGWLNRMLQSVPGLTAETAYAIGVEALPLLAGAAPVRNWSPEVTLRIGAQSRQLLDHIYHDDPLFREAATEALTLAADLDASAVARVPEPPHATPLDPTSRLARQRQTARLGDVDSLADFTAARLMQETRIAAFSLAGWDTHRAQGVGIVPPLLRLERVVLRLREGLTPDIWGRTTVIAMTEFGRTVAENGSGGTDHGTGGAMLLAGGAVRGGRVLGRWPGLDEASLYDRRDLMPTSDVRAWAAWAMAGLYGLDRTLLETKVFPGLSMGSDPGLLR